MLSLSSVLLVALAARAATAFVIWASPMQPGWPTILAVTNSNGSVLTNATYQWSFPTDDPSPSCTVAGYSNSACSGLVLDHTFSKAGNHTVQVTISDSSLPTSLSISATVMIKPLSSFPIVARPELRQLDAAHWNRTVSGLYRLMDMGVYSHLARIHLMTFANNIGPDNQRNAAHAGPSFLPWHRVSMRVVEVALQTVLMDPLYALPYFEWRLGWTGIESYIGPTGNPDTQIVEAGPFCNDPAQTPSVTCPKRWVLPDDFPDPVKAIKRNYGNSRSFHFQTAAEFDLLMRAPVYDDAPFSNLSSVNSFRNALEGWTYGTDQRYGWNHNGLHNWFGGTMLDTKISFFEPFFLFHHSQADNLFTQWQVLHQCTDGRANAVCYHPVAGEADVSGGMYTDKMYPWGITISEALKAGRGYRFLGSNEKPAPIATPIPNPTFNSTGNNNFGNGVQNESPPVPASAAMPPSASAYLAASIMASIWIASI